MMSLPASFPAGTRFADVEGVPVSCTAEYDCRAWDSAEPRRFPIDSFLRNGELVDESAFRTLVAHAAARRDASLQKFLADATKPSADTAEPSG